jgi:hypothetical protein
MLLGSIPAAARFCRVRPAAPGDPVAAVDQDQLAAGVDELRVERHGHHALRHIGGFSGGQRVVLRDIGHERIRHRKRARTVVDRGALVGTDLVAIKTGRLCARHGGPRDGVGEWRRHSRSADGSRTSQQIAAAQMNHDVSSPWFAPRDPQHLIAQRRHYIGQVPSRNEPPGSATTPIPECNGSSP